MTVRYGPVVALDGVHAEFRPGEVHALLGENGAGKSTMVGALAGFVAPSGGSASLDGSRLPLGDALGCRGAGIELVHQHFALVPAMTVGENLELARMGRLGGLVSSGAARRGAEIAAGLGWELPLEARVEALPVGARQRVEIVKALAGRAGVLVLDEPTATLAPGEVAELFRVLRALAGEGRIVVLIAHKLSEVLAVADRATVLRGGKVAGTTAIRETDAGELARWMLGREGSVPVPAQSGEGEAVLELRDVSAAALGGGAGGGPDLAGISFSVGTGGIFGVAGVDGNGQGLLAEVLAGLAPYRGETLWAGGARTMRDVRCGYVPEDRQRDGLARSLSVEENLLIGAPRASGARRGALVDRRALRRWADGAAARFGVQGGGASTRVGALSGGNGQKVVVVRALESDPELVVAANPTRGLDLGARETIHAALREAARTRPVVLVTSDLDELFALSGRTAFLSRGRLREGRDPALMAGWRE